MSCNVSRLSKLVIFCGRWRKCIKCSLLLVMVYSVSRPAGRDPGLLHCMCVNVLFAFFCSLLVCLLCAWCVLVWLWKPLVGVVTGAPAYTPAAHHTTPAHLFLILQSTHPYKPGRLPDCVRTCPPNWTCTLVNYLLLFSPVSHQTISPWAWTQFWPPAPKDLEHWSPDPIPTLWLTRNSSHSNHDLFVLFQ